jgi:xanthine dehydrogenase accessory factor
MTERRIGDVVRAGQIVGGLGNEPVTVPIDGVLLGLSARGARIESGDTLVEVDPDGMPHRCYGIAAGPRRLAASVLSAFAIRVARPRASTLPADAMVGASVAR